MVDIVAGLKAIQEAQSNPKDQIPAAGFKATVAVLHHGLPPMNILLAHSFKKFMYLKI